MQDELERLSRLIKLSSATIWRIETRGGTKKGSYEGDTVEETLEALEKRYKDLAPDTYILKYRTAKTNEKGQDSEVFVVSKNSKDTQSITPNSQMDSATLMMLMQLVQAQSEMKINMEYMKRDIDELKGKLKEVYEELTDDDPKNDKSAISKLGELVEQAPKIANGIKSFKEIA